MTRVLNEGNSRILLRLPSGTRSSTLAWMANCFSSQGSKCSGPPELYTYVRDSALHPDRLSYFRHAENSPCMTPLLACLHATGARLRFGTDSGTTNQLPTRSTSAYRKRSLL